LSAATGVGPSEELVVQRHDLPPVGGLVGVHGLDRRLDLVRARSATTQATPHELPTLRDERGVPPRAVLGGQWDECAVAVRARIPARRGEQHQREQAHRLGLVRHELDEQAAEPGRLSAQVVAHERSAA
jgi:hypothetical protein